MTPSWVRHFRGLLSRVQEIERRLSGSAWNGKVAQVDAEKALVRHVLGKDPEGNDVLGPLIPVSQPAGAMKIHSLPSVGQTMTIRSVDGDLEQGVAHPYNWNKDNPSPSQNKDEHIMTFGDVTITVQGGGIVFSVGAVTVNISSDGLTVNGGQVQHNNKDIGSTHTHTGVIPGAGLTGTPS